MDPNLQAPGAHELPPVQQTVDMMPRVQAPEVTPMPGERAPRPGQPQIPMARPAQPHPAAAGSQQPLPQPADPAVAATSQIVSPAVADDVDLIEKEWVEKAKAIVAQTRHDPHAQNQEMNRFKADYMQKRYAKDVKLDEN